ncbi:MAG TPA: ATP-binding cassette domain-containing protein [Acidimicrobiia bacterium]|nr:ATP-binding cassette domain-containing protein [Acidimicrobiia bacterium]
MTAATMKRRAVVGAVLAAVAGVWLFTAPQYWLFTATTGLTLAISTLGLLVLVGWAREVSLAQAGLTATAIYLCGFAMRSGAGWHWPYLAAAALGIGVVVLLSLLVSLSTAKLSGIYIIILTLALQVTIEKTFFSNIKLVETDPEHTIHRPALFGVHLISDRAYFLFALAVLGLCMVFLARLRASRFGRGLMLAGTDRQAAASVGVSPWRAKIFAFALAGFFAGLAGVVTAPLYPTPPSYISYLSINSLVYLAIPVLAGFRSLVAVAVVAMVFSVAPQALEHLHISPLMLGAIGLLSGTLTGPTGVSGLILAWIHSRRRSRGGEERVDLRDPTGWAEDARQERHARALAVLEEYLPERSDVGDVLVANDVSIAFGGLQALSDVSLTVPTRKLVGLIGPNGAGKSTLFDILNGLRQPDSGSVLLFGQDVSQAAPWNRAALGLSRTFQSSRVNLDLTVGENLMAGAYLMIPGNVAEAVAGMPRARTGERKAQEAARAVAELLDVAGDWDEFVRNLDFGAQRRVEIGRSLLSGPRLLLLDEPAAGLDANEATALFALIRRLEQDLGLTVLLVEHYVKAVLENCDLIYVLARGRIIAAGSADEITADPEVRAVYLGEDYQPREEVRADA